MENPILKKRLEVTQNICIKSSSSFINNYYSFAQKLYLMEIMGSEYYCGFISFIYMCKEISNFFFNNNIKPYHRFIKKQKLWTM